MDELSMSHLTTGLSVRCSSLVNSNNNNNNNNCAMSSMRPDKPRRTGQFIICLLISHLIELRFKLICASLIEVGDRLLDIPCKVCGDRSSGKHYGIFSCDGTSLL